MSESFKVGDLVWAKLKGFCPWPGQIEDPQLATKKPPKKNGYYWVYFYGSKNYSWIDHQNIKDYIGFRSKLHNANKTALFKQSVVEVDDIIKNRGEDSNGEIDLEDIDTTTDSEFDRILKNESKPATSSTKKPRKDSTSKRSWTESTSKSPGVSKKKKMSAYEENGASPSAKMASGSNSIKFYEEILNRPTVLDAPDSTLVDINDVSEALKSKNIEASTKSFGFLGLGIMGSSMVRNLIYTGHRVNIWNRTDSKAEHIKKQADENFPNKVEMYPNPIDVVRNSDIIFCCVSDPNAVKEVVAGNLGVVHKVESLDGKGYVEMSSVDLETSIDMCKMITELGGRYLEAQLQGSKSEAESGSLIIIGAGDKSLFDDCCTCFRAIGKTAFYLGEVGYATKMNLVLQLMKGVALVGLAEGFALADRSGISVKDVLEVFSLTSVFSPYLKQKAELLISMNFRNVEHPIQHMQKDMKQALNLADTLKQPLLMSSTANEVYKHARRLGYDSHDAASVYVRARY